MPELDLAWDTSEFELIYVFLPQGAKRSEILEAKPAAQEVFSKHRIVEIWLEYDESTDGQSESKYVYRPVQPRWEEYLIDQSESLSRALVFKTSNLNRGAGYAIAEVEEQADRPGYIDFGGAYVPSVEEEPMVLVGNIMFKMPGELVLLGVRELSFPLPELPIEPGFYFLDASYSGWRTALEDPKLLSDSKYKWLSLGGPSDWKINYVDDLLALAWVPNEEWRPVVRHQQYRLQNRVLWRISVYSVLGNTLTLNGKDEDGIALVDVSPPGLPALVFELASSLKQGETVGICNSAVSFLFHKGGPQDWRSPNQRLSQDRGTESSGGQTAPTRQPAGENSATPPGKWSRVNSYGLWGWRGETLIQLLPPFGKDPAKVFYLDEIKETITESQLVLCCRGDFPDDFELTHLIVRGEKVKEQRTSYSKTKEGEVFFLEPANPFLKGEYYRVTYTDIGKKTFIFQYVSRT
ncbi:hypothetical protein J7J84_07015 [bacterium]|nr:hypothetical protein [bacterium]